MRPLLKHKCRAGVTDVDPASVPYFSLIVVPGDGHGRRYDAPEPTSGATDVTGAAVVVGAGTVVGAAVATTAAA